MATLVKSDIAGNAPQWALDRAQALVPPEENILGVYVISDENRRNILMQPCAIGVCPLFWPHLIIMSPCLAAQYFVAKAVAESLVYVLTNRRLYKSIDPKTGGAVCCSPGQDSGEVELTSITGLGIDLPGNAFGIKCCPTKQVVLSLPLGHALAERERVGRGSHRHLALGSKMVMYVDNPQEVVSLIRSVKDAAPGVAPSIVVQAAPVQPMEIARDDPAEQIASLKKLLDAGALTQEEFDQKKTELLSRI